MKLTYLYPLLLAVSMSLTAFSGVEYVTLTDPPQDFDFFDPCVSPDGNYIAFSRSRNLPMVAERAIGGGWSVSFLPFTGTAEITWPAVSKDGEYAAFGKTTDAGRTILLYDDPFGTPVLIDLLAEVNTHFGARDEIFDPVFTPCGDYLYFAAKHGSTGYLYRRSFPGGSLESVYSTAADLYAPSASEEGDTVVFGKHVSGDYSLWVKQNSIPFNLEDGYSSTMRMNPVVSANGEWVAFQDRQFIYEKKLGEEGGELQEIGFFDDGPDGYEQRVAILAGPEGSAMRCYGDASDPFPQKTIGLSSDGRVAQHQITSELVPEADTDHFNIFVFSSDVGDSTKVTFGSPNGVYLSRGNPGSGAKEPPAKISLPTHSVNVSTLDLVLKGTLFHLRGWGYPVHVTMTYNNSDTTAGDFGPGWRMNYESSCTISGYGVQVRKGSGEALSFLTTNSAVNLQENLTGDITLAPPEGVTETMTINNTLIKRTRLKDLITFEYTRYSGDENNAWLTAIEDRNGNRLTMTPKGDDHTKVFSVSDDQGQVLSFTYGGPNGQCSKISVMGDVEGRTIEFAYNSTTKRLTRITDMAKNTGQYSYDAEGNMTRIRNGMPFAYVDDENSIPAGTPVRTVDIVYPTGSKEVRDVRENGMDPVRYERVSGKPGQVRRTSRGSRPFIYGSNLDNRTERFTDPLGNSQLIGYDNGQPTSFISPKGDEARIEYNEDGFPAQVTDPLGNVTKYEYLPGTGLVTYRTPPGHTRAQSWRTEYDSNHNPIKTISPMGYTNKMTYGSKGELLSAEDPAGNLTDYTYTSYGHLMSITAPANTNPAWLIWGFAGREFHCEQFMDPEGNGKKFEYDKNERLTNLEYSDVPGDPSLALQWDAFHQSALTDALGNITLFEHNLFGLRTKITSTMGQTILTEYDIDNHILQKIDPLGRVTTRQYDDAGRLISVQKPVGKNIRTYDENGLLATYQTPSGGITTYTYDKNRNRIQTHPEGMSPINFTYTAKGELNTIINARGQTITHTYDLDGRLTGRSISGVGQDQIGYDSRGLVTSLTPGGGYPITRTYDANRRVVSMQWSKSGGGTFTASFEYDQNDHLTRMTYPDGTVVDYTYDRRNRMQLPKTMRNAALREAMPGMPPLHPLSVTWTKSGVGTWSATAQLDAAAKLIALQRTNGTDTAWAYDKASRNTNLVHSSTNEGIFGQAIKYNLDNTTSEMKFDPSLNIAFTPSKITATYDAQDRLTSFDGSNPVYDADGNCTTAPGGEFTATYDALNRMQSITHGASTRTFIYDVKDRVIGWTEGSTTRRLHRDPSGRILFESDGDGTIVALTIYHGKYPLCRGLPETGWIWFHFDRNGNTVALTDDAGTVIANYTYLPYGTYQVSGNPDDNYLTYGGAYGVVDHGEGILQMGRRTYDVNTRRFLQRDPIGFKGGDNLYAYAGGNPVDFIDPAGTSIWDVLFSWNNASIDSDRAKASHDTEQALFKRAMKGDPRAMERWLKARDRNKKDAQDARNSAVDAVKETGKHIIESAVTAPIPGVAGQAVGVGIDAAGAFLGDDDEEEEEEEDEVEQQAVQEEEWAEEEEEDD